MKLPIHKERIISKIKAQEFILGNRRTVRHLHDGPDTSKEVRIEQLTGEVAKLKAELVVCRRKIATAKRIFR